MRTADLARQAGAYLFGRDWAAEQQRALDAGVRAVYERPLEWRGCAPCRQGAQASLTPRGRKHERMLVIEASRPMSLLNCTSVRRANA